jgi:hypothetical protein
MWPSGVDPRAPPSRLTSRLRASVPLTAGHGCPGRQLPSISRAATPAIRTFGPSAHQIGPSPSHTSVGVHRNVAPARTTGAAAAGLPGGRKFQPTRAIANLIRNRTANPCRSEERAHRAAPAPCSIRHAANCCASKSYISSAKLFRPGADAVMILSWSRGRRRGERTLTKAPIYTNLTMAAC